MFIAVLIINIFLGKVFAEMWEHAVNTLTKTKRQKRQKGYKQSNTLEKRYKLRYFE